MTRRSVENPADLSHAVLIRIAEFLRTVPSDQLAALADGTAHLVVAGAPSATGAVVPSTTGPAATAPAPATRRTRTTAAKAPAAVDTDRIRADLAAIDDRVAAGRYLDDLGLKVAELRALAAELGVALPSRATKATISKSIVQATVGRRLTSAVLSRPATGG
ncbi:hypothetical protein O7632_07830 [Solwaraspora sp. WMMD406]|uniref:hypothetical protein n=1 Tax=Solwaraspora sp. WMMD406 TaxID=3016095 RepID=UPI0024168326|nr:hypothetical protein [Solwaraspora sp. WMMD406]MDG4764013.1 hypothetical protein [Solwaraspora sp. WMMD406]